MVCMCKIFTLKMLNAFCLLFTCIFIGIILVALILSIYFIYLKNRILKKRKVFKEQNEGKLTVGLFHPYCNAGGGGERVLWCAIRAMQKRYPQAIFYIYTGDLEVFPEEILKNVQKNFNISIENDSVKFVYLHKRKWVEGETFSCFTLIAQSIGSMWLALEAVEKLQPDLFIDTMGYAFTYPIFKYICQCKVASYTHFPTITTEMLSQVHNRVVAHNNRQRIANSPLLTHAKLIYYRIFAKIYGVVGRCSDAIMVNSTWTEDHINDIWGIPMQTHRVYPPCDVEHLKSLTKLPYPKIKIVSIGQFRPEKNHPLQLRAMYELRTILKTEESFDQVELIIIGSCRNNEDRVRVKDMQDLCKHLSLENHVKFKINITYEELQKEYREATIGLHTMWNEHFGIGIVECMAAGLIMVAHKSGGPLRDIVETSAHAKTGYLATTDQEYACAIAAIVYKNNFQREIISNRARASVDRFSEREFDLSFARVMAPLFNELLSL